MIDVIATILMLYLLYKLIFDFIVPVSKTTAQFKNHMNETKRMHEEQIRRQQQQNAGSKNKPAQKNSGTTTTTDGEYIDYEEIK